MKRFSLLLLLVSFTIMAFSGNAEAATCRVLPGSGGESVFPGWPSSKMVILHVHGTRTLWVSQACGKPVVSSKLDDVVRFEDARSESNVASGWRIYLSPKAKMVGQDVPVTIKVRGRTLRLTAKVRANAVLVAHKAAKTASDAKDTADEAVKTANEAHANSGGTGGSRNIELTLGPLFSLESPGHEGYGMALGVNAILGKFASKGMVQLGISGRLSWHYYEQEVTGLAQNSDVMAHEFDAMAMFLFRLRPVSWFAAEASTGFGMRIFTHDDTVTIQDQNLLIRGVEGRVAAHPLWGLNLGVKFWPSKVVSLSINWAMTVALTRQVQNPNAEGGDPSKAHVINHFLGAFLGIHF